VTRAAVRVHEFYETKGLFGVRSSLVGWASGGCGAQLAAGARFDAKSAVPAAPAAGAPAGPSGEQVKEANNPLSTKVSINLQNYYVGR